MPAVVELRFVGPNGQAPILALGDRQAGFPVHRPAPTLCLACQRVRIRRCGPGVAFADGQDDLHVVRQVHDVQRHSLHAAVARAEDLLDIAAHGRGYHQVAVGRIDGDR